MRTPIEAIKDWLRIVGAKQPEQPGVEITPQSPSSELRGIPSTEDQILIKGIVSKLVQSHLIGRKPIGSWKPTFGWGQVFDDVSVLSFTDEQLEIIRELHRRAVLSNYQFRSRKPEHITLVKQENGPDGVHIGEDFYFPLIYQPMISSINMRETFRKLFNGEEVDFSIHSARDTINAVGCIRGNIEFLRGVSNINLAPVNLGSEKQPRYSLPRTIFGKLEVVDAAEVRSSYAGQLASISQ